MSWSLSTLDSNPTVIVFYGVFGGIRYGHLRRDAANIPLLSVGQATAAWANVVFPLEHTLIYALFGH
jgi:hypothetical protein